MTEQVLFERLFLNCAIVNLDHMGRIHPSHVQVASPRCH